MPPRKGAPPDYGKGAPRFHLSGHFHSRARTWTLGPTTVVQAPAALIGRAATLTLPEGAVEFIDLG